MFVEGFGWSVWLERIGRNFPTQGFGGEVWLGVVDEYVSQVIYLKGILQGRWL